MRKRGKRYLSTKERLGEKKEWTPLEALKLIKEISNCKFEESVEVAVALNIDLKKGKERVRGTVILPCGSGKKVRVLVFAEGEKAEEARKKDLWVEPIEISRIIKDFPVELLTPIKWIKQPDLKHAQDSLALSSEEILVGCQNSLVHKEK